MIEAVRPACDPAPAVYDSAPRVGTEGFIYPGLIDLHNHLAYGWPGPDYFRRPLRSSSKRFSCSSEL